MAVNDQAIRNMFISYPQSAQAFTDVRTALASFKDLRPGMKPFTYNNGHSKNLVALEGTIPISYKAKTYNIPIIIWLHETHPYNAPMVYVQPTATMNIKAGPHVEANGTVQIPYLREWRQGSSDMTTLISMLCMQFGESPPVFGKPKNQPAQAIPQRSAAQPSAQPTGHTPYPVSGGGGMPTPGMPTPYQPNSTTSYPPQPPNYNSSTNSGYSQHSGYNPYGPTPPQATGSTPYPAAPGHHGAGSGYPGMYGTGSAYGNPPYPAANNSTPYPNPGASHSNPPYPTPHTSTHTSTPYTTTNTYSPYPSTTTYTNPAASANQQSMPERQNSFGISDDQMKQSLLTAVQDKMRRKVKDIFQTHNVEMEVLRKTQEDLSAGQSQLDTMAQTIEKETTELEQTTSILDSRIPQLKEEIEKNKQGETPPPEEAIETTAPLYRQLLQCFSEEQAIEDTLYILGDALRREVIGIEIYLKKVRDLSRKQFMLRALMQRCREKAGLSDVYS